MSVPEGSADGATAEVNRRFFALMEAEFGLGRAPEGPDEDDLDLDETPWLTQTVQGRPWSPLTAVGLVMLAAGLTACLVMVFGLQVDAPWPQVAALTAVTGLAVCLTRALRRHHVPDDEGAIL